MLLPLLLALHLVNSLGSAATPHHLAKRTCDETVNPHVQCGDPDCADPSKNTPYCVQLGTYGYTEGPTSGVASCFWINDGVAYHDTVFQDGQTAKVYCTKDHSFRPKSGDPYLTLSFAKGKTTVIDGKAPYTWEDKPYPQTGKYVYLDCS